MNALFLFLIALAIATSAYATPEYYVKDGNSFRKVEKTDAVLSLLKKAQVYSCNEQRLTKKLTLKNVSKNDD